MIYSCVLWSKLQIIQVFKNGQVYFYWLRIGQPPPPHQLWNRVVRDWTRGSSTRGRCSTSGSSPGGALKLRTCSGLDVSRALKTWRCSKYDPNILFSFWHNAVIRTRQESQCLPYARFFLLSLEAFLERNTWKLNICLIRPFDMNKVLSPLIHQPLYETDQFSRG